MMVALLVAVLAGTPDATATFERARALLEHGDAAAASPLFEQAVALAPNRADFHEWLARSYTAEAKQSTNAVRLAYLGWNIGTQLEEAVRLDPSATDARVRLLQYYVTAPRVVGGSMRKARDEARKLARRDAALGAWAEGYLAYRAKRYDAARRHFNAAIAAARDPKTKALALQWLGWLSQETQQYEVAFATWRQLLTTDPTQTQALYEIARTASFCHCRAGEGERALRQYMSTPPRFDQPPLEDARKLLEKLRPSAAP